MTKSPLIDGVMNYIKEGNIYFAMPGHKGGNGFLRDLKGRELYENILRLDITEVDGVDNLHHPEGIIKEAEDLLRDFYGSRKSYFLVNGSTSGNLAMIFSSFNEGDKVIVERNCHRSILNGIIMRKLNPIYIKNKYNRRYNAPLSIDEGHFFDVLENNKDAKGIILTYPNYYGVCCDLQNIISKAKAANMRVLIDSAHGAHFGINELLPENALKLGADMVVVSSHKTLPSLTQTSYLHVGKECVVDMDKIDFYVSSFLSTSPSYILMCSMDYARYYLEKEGDKDYRKLLSIANKYREKINTIYGLHVLGEEDIKEEIGLTDVQHKHNKLIDLTRYVINVQEGYSGNLLADYLRNKKIQVEMSDNQNIVLIFSPFNIEDEFEYLYNVLRELDLEIIKSDYIDVANFHIPKSSMAPYEVMDSDKELIDFNLSIGRICAEAIVPYPPGVPLIMPGEIIDNDIIRVMKYCINSEITTLGIKENKISVVTTNTKELEI
ncbi:MAG: aminotransferase class V-fold PLP-dependent enzyme [Bacillota bacterium]|nr:aminotransferase class V-fold PLP-dependent enzyme [Bacillota bacterium]